MPVGGVTDVLSFGGEVRQYQVQLDPQRLLAYGLGIDEVTAAVEANNRNAGGWYLDRGAEQLVIRGVGWVRSGDDGLREQDRAEFERIRSNAFLLYWSGMLYDWDGEVNDAFIEKMGYTREEVIGRKCFEVFKRATNIAKEAPEGEPRPPAEVVGEVKGDKINGFTYKNKSNQRRRWGHRQQYNTITITGISKG